MWEYLAGLFDGEGSLFFTRGGETTMRPIPHVSLSNTSREIQPHLQAVGFKVRWIAPKSPNAKPIAHYFIHNQHQQLAVLEHLLPHLIIKKIQAALMIQLLRRRLTRPVHPYNAEELGLARQITALNSRKGRRGTKSYLEKPVQDRRHQPHSHQMGARWERNWRGSMEN